MGVSYKLDKSGLKKSPSFKKWEPKKLKLETALSFKNFLINEKISEKTIGDLSIDTTNSVESLREPATFFSPRPVSELDAAAVQVQKFYKSYRTRSNLADCAVVAEELWWKALDFTELKQNSLSFFSNEKPESAVSRWARARTLVAKVWSLTEQRRLQRLRSEMVSAFQVGKRLLKNEKAQQLALRHWHEAIDPRHRYGHNLKLYYDVWFISQSRQPFFYWLDVVDGKEVNLE